ncbi:MAG: response regulator [Spirochaetaceae bacterium]|jgi:putative two-component system response regulator|nr:response regulator [Spirochaetaceae bacterium]
MGEKKIFFVDDNITNLLIGKNALKDHFQTFTMPSAAKMFELLEKVKPDAILLDIEMPEMSGYEAMEKLKASEYKNIPVLFVTGNENTEDEQKGLSMGAKGYIRKPFSNEDLIGKIEKLFS